MTARRGARAAGRRTAATGRADVTKDDATEPRRGTPAGGTLKAVVVIAGLAEGDGGCSDKGESGGWRTLRQELQTNN